MRLIDADALMEEFAKFVRRSNNSDFAPIPTWNDAVSLTGSAPTVDAVEVVRCKDCKWFGDFGCAIRIVDDSDKPTENDYCSFAEEKRMSDWSGDRSGDYSMSDNMRGEANEAD